MAAASDLVDAVRTGHGVRQRVYRPAGGTKGTESFGARRRGPREADRLHPHDIEDLEALWGMFDSSMGMRSVHGAVEARLRRAPPRDDVRGMVLRELDRAGGRAPEGAILRIVCSEKGFGTSYEVERAITMLRVYGKIERVAVPSPASHKGEADEHQACPRGDGTGIESMRMLMPPDRLTAAQRQWTGYDLRLVSKPEKTSRSRLSPRERLSEMDPVGVEAAQTVDEVLSYDVNTGADIEDTSEIGERVDELLTMRLSLRSTRSKEGARAAQWRRQDEALEAEHHRIECSESSGGFTVQHDDHLSARQRGGIERGSSTLALISQRYRLVIRSWYFEAKEDLLAIGEMTEHALQAMQERCAPTPSTVIRWLFDDATWMEKLNNQAESLVTDASIAYKDARRSLRAS
jgi:hypothetical protein